jgi:hypothetical protein
MSAGRARVTRVSPRLVACNRPLLSQAHRFYERLGFVASHEGMKLILDRA